MLHANGSMSKAVACRHVLALIYSQGFMPSQSPLSQILEATEEASAGLFASRQRYSALHPAAASIGMQWCRTRPQVSPLRQPEVSFEVIPHSSSDDSGDVGQAGRALISKQSRKCQTSPLNSIQVGGHPDLGPDQLSGGQVPEHPPWRKFLFHMLTSSQ
jgi:hypothetical protein